jgi:3-oxoacyl-[acyl-carrier protein] reductase
MAMNGTLAGKVALITGGSRGIGAGIVKRLAREGAVVAFTYSSAAQKADEVVAEVEAAGGRALAIQADSADAQAVQRAVEQAVSALGRLDIFVNNAGILLRGGLDTYALEDFDRMVAVNVRAVFVGAQAASRRMGVGGRIIVIGSVAAERTAFAGSSVYSMTKAAVAGLVRGMALDLAPRAITVNTVQPGPTASDMAPAEGPLLKMIENGLVPLRRMGRDEEIASLVAYLAGPESSFVTGSSLTIDGGYLA